MYFLFKKYFKDFTANNNNDNNNNNNNNKNLD